MLIERGNVQLRIDPEEFQKYKSEGFVEVILKKENKQKDDLKSENSKKESENSKKESENSKKEKEEEK